MAELFRFRCSECAKLLGVPPRKVGRAVHCPRCGAELIVPSPDDVPTPDGEADADDAAELADLGIDLGFGSALAGRPADRPSASASASATAAGRPPNEAEALAFLDKITAEGLAEPDPPAGPADPDELDEDGEPEPIVATPAEPLAARRRAGHPRESSYDRRRDVSLPRTAVTAWALFALLALGLSFTAGLLLGHYHWK